MRARAGYTLLELVVVLAILGLVTAMVGPRVFRLIDAWRAETAYDSVRQQLEGLPLLARTLGRNLTIETLPATDFPEIAVPDGVSLVLERPLVVHANGVCESTELMFQRDTRRYRLRLNSPLCRVERDASL